MIINFENNFWLLQGRSVFITFSRSIFFENLFHYIDELEKENKERNIF